MNEKTCHPELPVFPLPRACPGDVWQSLFQMARSFEASLPESFFSHRGRCELTIVMLSHESFAETRRAIRSIQERVRVPFQMILFDNASSPATQAHLRALAADDARIELVLSMENLGCAGGRAAALEKVGTDFVLLIDNDVEVLPGSVEYLLQALERRLETVAATGKVVLADGFIHVCGGDYRVENGILRQELLGYGRRFDADIGPTGPCRWMPGCLTMFRTDAFRRHPLDRKMKSYYEDTEWCYRLNQLGEGSFLRCVEALAIHYHETKVPSADLPIESRRRQAMKFVETLAYLYRRHGVIGEALPLFVPELAGCADGHIAGAGRLLFELVDARGGDWVLEQWNRGWLAPLFDVRERRSALPAESKASLEATVPVLEALVGELRDNLAERNERIRDLRLRVAELETWLAEMRDNLAERNERIQELLLQSATTPGGHG